MRFDPLSYVMRLYGALFLAVLLYELAVSLLDGLVASIGGAWGAASAVPLIHGLLGLLFVGGIAAVLALRVLRTPLGMLHQAYYWYRLHVRPRPPEPHGAHFATRAELEEAGLLGKVGWPVGIFKEPDGTEHVARLPPERERANVKVIAETGTYKTSGPVISAILSETLRPPADRRCLIIGDPKDELGRLTIDALRRTHRVLIWDLSNPRASTVTFDPFASLPDRESDGFVDVLRDISDSFFWPTRRGTQTTDPFWITQPQTAMRAGFVGYATTPKVTDGDLTRMGFLGYGAETPRPTFVGLANTLRGMSIGEFTRFLQESPSEVVRRYAAQMAALAQGDEAVAGVWSDVVTRFELVDSPGVQAAMQPDRAINWRSFLAQPTALYLRIARRERERLGPLLSFFLSRMFAAFEVIADEQPNRALPRPVRCIIDEFGHLGRIHGLESALGEMRSRDLGHMLVIQNTAQVHQTYEDAAAVILGHLTTKLCLGGASQEDAEWMSRRCGTRTVYRRDQSYGSQGGPHAASTGASYRAEQEPLIDASTIIHMKNELVMSTGGVSPVRLRLYRYFEHPEMATLVPSQDPPPPTDRPPGPMPVVEPDDEPPYQWQ